MFRRDGRAVILACAGRSAASVMPLGDDRPLALAVVRVGLAVASAHRMERHPLRAEPRDANARALGQIVSARAGVEIAEQAARAADTQASAAGLAETGGRRTAAIGQCDDDGKRSNDQWPNERAAHD